MYQTVGPLLLLTPFAMIVTGNFPMFGIAGAMHSMLWAVMEVMKHVAAIPAWHPYLLASYRCSDALSTSLPSCLQVCGGN